jgi:hypothetical protein
MERMSRSRPLEQKRIEEMYLDERVSYAIRYQNFWRGSHEKTSETANQMYDAVHPQTQWILDRFLKELCGFTMEELRNRDAMVKRIKDPHGVIE